MVNTITTRSSGGPERFVSRMFAPGYIPGDEDHVCGTAHSLLTPYWSQKLNIPRGEEIEAKQVSPRGGDLKILWDPDTDIIHLRGLMVDLVHGDVLVP